MYQLPIYWTSDLTFVINYDSSKFNTIEKEVVKLLQKFHTIQVYNLLEYEGALNRLVNFIYIVILIWPYL